MCSGALIKLLEWTGMLNLTLYSFLTLIYVLNHSLLTVALLALYNDPLDLLLALYSLFISCFLYVQALACLTATDRMQAMTDAINVLLTLPGYVRVKAMRRNQRVYLIFGHFLQIQYSMMFKNRYKLDRDQVMIEYANTVNFG